MTKELEQFNIFRRFESSRLVIFERQGTLLHRNDCAEPMSLADIDATAIQVLCRLRDLGIGFGFISDQQGVGEREAGHRPASVLINILDGILGAYNVAPNFWLAWPPIAEPNRSTPFTERGSPDPAAMIDLILQQYRVEISNCVFVGTSPMSVRAAARLGMDTIEYQSVTGSKDLRSGPVAQSNQEPRLEIAQWISLQIAGLPRTRSDRWSPAKARHQGTRR